MLIMVINHTQTVSMIKEIQTATVLLGNYCYKQHSRSSKAWIVGWNYQSMTKKLTCTLDEYSESVGSPCSGTLLHNLL
jgi:hypothetical protein